MNDYTDKVLVKSMVENVRLIKDILNKCSDIVYREFTVAQQEQIKATLVYLDGLSDQCQISNQITGEQTTNLQEIIDAILSGATVLLADGNDCAVINRTRGWKGRSITEPETESALRGPQDSFVETLCVNTALIRRKIKSPNLKMELLQLGTISKTDVALVYLEGIVSEKMVEEVRIRLSRIDVDAVLDSAYIEELIEDNPWSPFPTINHTERPDRVAAMLLEGRVAILVDGTPVALTAPNLFIEYLHTPGDYYERSLYGSAVRLIRFIAMITALTLPSLYVAVQSFHQELIPTTLLLNIAANREALPLPILLEVFIAEMVFEILREISNRLPRAIGQITGVLIAILLGGITVWAGLFAPTTPIVIFFAGISSIIINDGAGKALRLLSVALLILSGFLGLLGLLSGVTIIVIHMCTLRSFGIPYLSPLAPTDGSDLDDSFLRAPWWAMFSRPRLIARRNRKRQGTGLKPTVR